ncbi:MAG: glycine--tRNA ligase [Candidatus Paceibacterota bacterium]
MSDVTMEKIISLAKRRGFVYPGSEIYGGLSGTWDYGPLGVELKNNVKQLWWRTMVQERDDMLGIDAAILMNAEVWKASGHVEGFSDPLVECVKCKRRFRADQVGDTCPECSGAFGGVRQFNMMFKTQVGAVPENEAAAVYLRPETAGGIFVNFKNIVDSFHPKLPFGIAQIGKAFRNEIAPRDFVFRSREFEQMEIEYFVRPAEWEDFFEKWRGIQLQFAERIGLSPERIHQIEVAPADRAHYSKRSIDTEFDFPFGQKELWGLAYRSDFDLSAHTNASGTDLSYLDDAAKEKFLPHVIEPTFGLDRTILAIITSAYTEDELGPSSAEASEGKGEKRVYLKFPFAVAPIKAAIFPLLKNKPELVAKAREVYLALKNDVPQIMWDDNGNIGKRYRRQDEIGTPYCVTIDFDTLGENAELLDTVTVRDRDTGEQERIAIAELKARLF